MKQLYLILLLTLVLGCKKNPEKTIVQEHEWFLLMEKTACFGTCPVYIAWVNASGELTFKGDSFVPKAGSHEFQIKAEEVDLIYELVHSTDFFSLKDRYYGDMTDLPTIYFTFNDGTKEKRIMNYYGGPESLKTLENAFEKIIFDYLDQ